MKLKNIFEFILKEQDELEPISANEDIIEVPNANFVISIFANTKTLLFSPQEHTSVTKQIRSLINMLKQQFRVSTVTPKDNGAFEIKFDLRENFDAVIDFIKLQVKEKEEVVV